MMNIVLAWPHLPKTSVIIQTVTVTKAPDGTKVPSEIPSSPVEAYIARPKAKYYSGNESGKPVVVDFNVFFLGVPAINMDDRISFKSTSWEVKEIFTPEIGNFTRVGVKRLEEIPSA